MNQAATSSKMQTSSNPENSHELSAISIKCFDPDNLSEPCPICEGKGVIKHNVEVGHSDFGKLFRCPNSVSEADSERKEKLRRLGNLDAYFDKTLENFYVSIPGYSNNHNLSLGLALKAAQEFISNPSAIIVFEGVTGSGKTHLAAAIGNAFLEFGRPVWLMNAPDLLDHLRSTYSPNSDVGYDQMFERVRTVDLLILDDLGIENPSPWAQEKLFQIIDYRYTHLLPTVITTNTRIEDMEARLRSRLLDHHQDRARRIVINAPDYRTNGRTQGFISNSLNSYSSMTFDTFNVNTTSSESEYSNLRRIFEAAINYASKPQGWFILIGDYGTGKTHLAAAIANHVNQQSSAILVTIPDLMDYLRQTFDPSINQRFDYRFELVRDSKLLVLDDLKSDYSSSWVKEKLFQILDYRYVRNLPTVITASSDNYNNLDARINSRVSDIRTCITYSIEAKSYSKRIRQNNIR